MLILGVNAFHDSSAVLFADGELVVAAEEERFTRVKHNCGLPMEATRWVLSEAGVKFNELDHIASSFDPEANRSQFEAMHHAFLEELPQDEREPAWIQRIKRVDGVAGYVRSIPHQLARGLEAELSPSCLYHAVEHHPSHISSAFFASEFTDAAVCSVDGFGDFVSVAWGVGTDNHIDVDHRVFFPHSIGMFYTAITHHLGFPHYGDEYKLMGLAPYGTPRFMDEMRRILVATESDFELDMRYFRHQREGFNVRVMGGSPVVGELFTPSVEELLGPRRLPGEPLQDRHRDLAASAQLCLEEVLLPIFDRLQRRTGRRSLALAGGVALNVTANSRITDATGFDSVFIQPAANDAGTSLGAALYVAHQTLETKKRFRMSHAYLGPSFTSDECAAKLEEAGLAYERLDEDRLCHRTAELLAEGKIVGWFQGRMEFGPRALGNRSILCDPRNPQMKEILNTRTKRRESFRPFAPSVLAERSSDIFDIGTASPYMLYAPIVRPQWRERIPAVTHVDGTSRIQTVHRETNERYWKLLRSFEALTGVPVLLNTSFNENEPIVCTPQEAIACYLRADMDVLVLEDLLLTSDARPVQGTAA